MSPTENVFDFYGLFVENTKEKETKLKGLNGLKRTVNQQLKKML